MNELKKLIENAGIKEGRPLTPENVGQELWNEWNRSDSVSDFIQAARKYGVDNKTSSMMFYAIDSAIASQY